MPGTKKKPPQRKLRSRQAPPGCLLPAEVASLCDVSVKTMGRWRLTRMGPPFVRVSDRRFIYRESDVEAWLERQRFDPNDTATPEADDTRASA